MNKGIIRISADLYNEYEIVGLIFQYFKPLRRENEYWKHNDFVIHGESKLFDVVENGCVIPEYSIKVVEKENKTFSFEFIKN